MTDDEFEAIKARDTYDDYADLLKDCASLIAEVERLRHVAAVAEKIKQAREERYERVRTMQALASEARRTGKSFRIPHQPRVFDLGDLVDDLVKALQ